MSNVNQTSSPEEHSNQNGTDADPGFFYRPKTIQWILRVFYALCGVLVVTDFIIHRHIETSIEKIPAFYAIYGFIACVVLVLIANQMRKALMRDEHYYDAPELTQGQDDSGRSGHE